MGFQFNCLACSANTILLVLALQPGSLVGQLLQELVVWSLSDGLKSTNVQNLRRKTFLCTYCCWCEAVNRVPAETRHTFQTLFSLHTGLAVYGIVDLK